MRTMLKIVGYSLLIVTMIGFPVLMSCLTAVVLIGIGVLLGHLTTVETTNLITLHTVDFIMEMLLLSAVLNGVSELFYWMVKTKQQEGRERK